MRAAELLLESLKASGIKYIFGLPGSTEAPLLDALVDETQIHYVLGLHEAVVIGMADGFARATGKPAIANLHTTVGTGNGLTGLFNAWKDHSPVVTIATHKDSRILSRDGFCVGPDLAQWARPVTKWSWQAIHADQLPNEIYRAIKVAGTAPYAPVFLCYPEDLLGEEVNPDLVGSQKPVEIEEDAWPSPSHITAVAHALANARTPIIIAGDEISSTHSSELLGELADLLEIPVFQESRRSSLTWNIAKDHPRYAGEYSSGHRLVREADVILALGCRLSVEFSPVATPDIPSSAMLIHVHRDQWEVGKLYPPEIAIVASVNPLLKGMMTALTDGSVSWDINALRPRFHVVAHENEAQGNSADADSSLLSPEDFAKALARHAPDSSVIVDEAIRSSPAILEHFPLRPGNYFHSSGGGLGWGLPCALGIQMAWPDRCVISAIGDGSLLFSIQALWTAVRENLGVKVIVANNAKYLAVKAGMVEYNHRAVASDKFLGVDLTDPAIDLVAIARGFGVRGVRADTMSQLDEALTWAFSEKGPVLVDVGITDAVLQPR